MTCGALTVGLAGLWALRPADVPPLDLPALPEVAELSENGTVEEVQIDPRAFNVALWNPPPPSTSSKGEPEVEQKVPPPPPLRVQLVAIVQSEDDGTLSAVLYDPDEDRLLVLREGDDVNGRQVASVTLEAVILQDDQVKHRLALDPERRGRS